MLAALSLSVLGVTVSASAQPLPTVALRYEVATAEPGCPDEEALRDLVRSRLGYDPFQAPHATEVAARIEGGHPFVGTITITTNGQPGERALESADCGSLGEAMAAAISLAVDPLGRGLAGATEPTPPTAAPRTTAPSPHERADPELPPALQPAPVTPRELPHLWLRLHGRAALGSAPATTLGADLGVGLRWRKLGVTVEGRFESTPGAQLAAEQRIDVSYLQAAVVPCFVVVPFLACAEVSVGMLRATGHDVADPRPVEAFTASMGARAGVFWTLPPFSLDAELSLLVPLVHAALSVGTREVWTTPPLAAALRLGVSVVF